MTTSDAIPLETESPLEVEFRGDVGQAFVGNHIQQLVVNEMRRAVEALALTPETVRRHCALYVAGPGHREAATALRRHRVVALLGRPGDGRRITAVRLADELGLPPHEMLLDADEPERPLSMKPGHAYLLDLSGLEDPPGPGTGEALLRHLADLPDGCVLMLRVTEGIWRGLGITDRFAAVRVRPPSSPTMIFAAHLAVLASREESDAWSTTPEIRAELGGARPPDAVRLARIVHDVLERGPRDHAARLEEAIAASRAWTDQLTDWFAQTTDPHLRALKISAAALEGAPIPTIFKAADSLAVMDGLPGAPGRGLTGPGVDELVASIRADRKGDRILFSRPEYADSVLRHVWSEHPRLHEVLGEWFAAVPTREPESQRAGHTLARMAIARRDHELLTRVAAAWARRPELFPLTVQVLTRAAISPELGRHVRRLLYRWASQSRARVVHLLVADVCGGEFGEAFPQVALTRLRHLADRDGSEVRDAVIAALNRRATGDVRPVLREIVEWITAGGGRGREDTGRAAFLIFADLRSHDGRITILDAETDRSLTDAWHATLRHRETRPTAVTAAAGWLEAAAQATADPGRVTAILGATCRSSLDRGVLLATVRYWTRTADGPAVFSRQEISDHLTTLASSRDPLTASREQSNAP